MSTKQTNASLSADQRHKTVAAILAKGVLRYHRRIGQLASVHDEKSQNISPEGLEVLGEPRLSVSERTPELT